jgi:hypothetical protein
MRLPQARRTWHSLFGESTLPILETSAEWTAWAQQTIDETEAQVNKVGHSPADVRGAPLGTARTLRPLLANADPATADAELPRLADDPDGPGPCRAAERTHVRATAERGVGGAAVGGLLFRCQLPRCLRVGLRRKRACPGAGHTGPPAARPWWRQRGNADSATAAAAPPHPDD